MSTETEEISINDRFEELVNLEDKEPLREFLNHLNISDVANLVYEYEDYEDIIIENMAVHRAAGVFKILGYWSAKKNYQKTAIT